MAPAMATEATVRNKADAFLTKISIPYEPVTEPTPDKPK